MLENKLLIYVNSNVIETESVYKCSENQSHLYTSQDIPFLFISSQNTSTYGHLVGLDRLRLF